MNRLSLFEIARCLGECREWHEGASSQLTDAERVQYHRQISLFEATKRWYRNVLDDDREIEVESKRQQKVVIVIGIVLVVVDAVFGKFDPTDVKLLIAIGTALLLYFSLADLLRRQSLKRTIRLIERDASAIGVTISQMYKGLQKEKEYERFWDSNPASEELKERTKLESSLLNYYFRMTILQKLANTNSSAKIPSCFYEVL